MMNKKRYPRQDRVLIEVHPGRYKSSVSKAFDVRWLTVIIVAEWQSIADVYKKRIPFRTGRLIHGFVWLDSRLFYAISVVISWRFISSTLYFKSTLKHKISCIYVIQNSLENILSNLNILPHCQEFEHKWNLFNKSKRKIRRYYIKVCISPGFPCVLFKDKLRSKEFTWNWPGRFSANISAEK